MKKLLNFSDYNYLNEQAENLDENREQNIQRIIKLLDDNGFEIFDKLTDANLEDMVLRLSAKNPGSTDGDRLDELVDTLFGASAKLPPKLNAKGEVVRWQKGSALAGQIKVDVESAEYKNLLITRLGGPAKINALKKAVRSALRASSAPTAEKLLYLYKLTKSSSLIDIKKIIKAQITSDITSLLPNGLPSSVIQDFYKAIAPLAPSGLGPVELWLCLHVKDCKLEGGKGGAAGDINTMDGSNPIEIKETSGVMTFGNPNYRGTGWSAAAGVLGKATGKKVAKKDWEDFCNHTGEAYDLFSKLRSKAQLNRDIWRAYMDPYTFDDKDVKEYSAQYLKLSGAQWEEYHMKMSVYGYWKYKDKKSGGNSFKAITFIDKKTGRFATIGCAGGNVKVPNGMKVKNINWIQGHQNYADGSTLVTF